MTVTADVPEIAEEDRLRADLYDFLGVLLAGPPSKALLKQAASLSGDDSDLGQAINALARVAQVTNERGVESEFTTLFIGLGRGELIALCQLLPDRLSQRKAAGQSCAATWRASRSPEPRTCSSRKTISPA